MEGFDLSTISDVYVGSTLYSEIYYGSNKVWPTETPGDYCKLTLSDDSVVYITDGSETLTGSMINPYRSNVVGVEFKGKKYTNILDQAFRECTLLTTVNLSPNITSIGLYVFWKCTSLTSIDLSNIISVDILAFLSCTSLTSVGDTSNIASIGNNAFNGCSSLTSVDLSSCTSIDNNAFLNCSSLTSIGDLSNITSIGNYVFYNCNKITGNIDIGSSCISLGIECFRVMSGLSSMTFMGTTPPTCGSNVFTGSTFIIRVPQSALETYKAADGFSNYASRIVGY